MHLPRLFVLSGLAALLALPAAVQAETKVELKGVHLCCPACTKAVGDVLKKFGAKVKGTCDAKAKSVTFTAPDPLSAQLVLDELAKAGFHGDTGDRKLAMRDSGATKNKVKSMTLTTHNCCGACCKAIKAALKKVDGVTGDTAKPKASTFEVTGNFIEADVVKALNDAGFHVGIKGNFKIQGDKLK